MKTKRRLWHAIFFALAALVLGGCVAGYADPYQQEAAAQAAIRATEQARGLAAQQATIDAGRLADQATATAAAWSWAATATQASLESTAQAEQATATAAAALAATQTAYPPQATATAGAWLAAQAEQARKEQAALVSFYAGLAWRVLLPGGLAALFLLVLWLAWSNRDQVRRFLEASELQARMIDRGPDKDPLTAARLQDGRIIIYDPARLPGAAAILGPGGVDVTGLGQSLPFAAQTVARAQAVDLVRAWPESRPDRREAAQAVTSLESPQPAALPDLPGVAPWQVLANWSGAGGLPLGLGPGGLVLADPEQSPHFLYAGTTGSGKTRAGLRPLAAAALGMGWRVVILDPSGLDFLPFRACPNANLVTLSEPAQAIEYLQALYGLIRERQKELAAAGVSTWTRLPGAGPHELVIIDEFSNLADSLPNTERESLWRSARMIAAEGRKAGVHLAIALQDPSHKSLDLRIRRNMTPVCFRVRDGDSSRVVLNAAGAEQLAPRQFLAVLGLALTRGVGFAPDDSELESWLAARPMPALPAPEWLSLPEPEPLVSPQAVDPPDSPGEPPELYGCNPAQVRRVLELAQQGLSQASIESIVFGFTGGVAYRKVKAILGDPQAAAFAGVAAPTTTTPPSGPLPAAWAAAD